MNQLPSPAALNAWALGTDPRSEAGLQDLEQLPPHHPGDSVPPTATPVLVHGRLHVGDLGALPVRWPWPGQPETKQAMVSSAERRLGGELGGPGSRTFSATNQRKCLGRSLLLPTLHFLSGERRRELKVVLPSLSPLGRSDNGSIVGIL